MSACTVLHLLNRAIEYLTAKNSDSPRLSAELLLGYVLNLQRIELYTQFDREVAKENESQLEELVRRAGEGEPIAYLIGKTEFYSIEMEITRDCMIPRPETELLADRAIAFIKSRKGKQQVCDLCTGCGCIAIALAKNEPNVFITATDISDDALKIAAKNIQKQGVNDRIKLLCGDLFEPLIPQLDAGKFDLIVCNPPYISSGEYESLDKSVKAYEPIIALWAGSDGLDIYRRTAEKVGDFLKADGGLILEIGYSQGPAVKELLEKTGHFAEIRIEKDYQDNDRIITGLKTAPKSKQPI